MQGEVQKSALEPYEVRKHIMEEVIRAMQHANVEANKKKNKKNYEQ